MNNDFNFLHSIHHHVTRRTSEQSQGARATRRNIYHIWAWYEMFGSKYHLLLFRSVFMTIEYTCIAGVPVPA
jgi:hypothetical protein